MTTTSRPSTSEPCPNDSSSPKRYQRKRKPPIRLTYSTTNKKQTNRTRTRIRKPSVCTTSYKRRVDGATDPEDSGKGKSSAVDRAYEIHKNLPANYRSFVKRMLKSHVTGGFWLGLPKPFCQRYLPKQDAIVILLDESGKETETKYLVEKIGLSGGWRGFSIAHKLLDGDVLVFHLIQPCRFKVYINRANGLDEIDGAAGLVNLDFQANISTADEVKIKDEIEDDVPPPTDQPANKNYHSAPEAFDGVRISESVLEFKDVKRFESFRIVVNGLVDIDSLIPGHLRRKYYELCRSQNTYLHGEMFKGLNCGLVAGMISETINIADAIKAANLTTTSCDSLQTWDKTLESFEGVRLKVGFLRARLKKLLSIPCEQREMIEAKAMERALVEKEMRELETKLCNVREAIRNLDAEMVVLNAQNLRREIEFKETAAASW